MQTSSNTSGFVLSFILLVVFAIISSIVYAFVGLTHEFIIMLIVFGIITLISFIWNIVSFIKSL